MIGYIVVKSYDYEDTVQVEDDGVSVVYATREEAERIAEQHNNDYRGVQGIVWEVRFPTGDEDDPVAVGQVWASNDRRDIALGARQHRVVTSVSNGRAFLRTEGSRLAGSFGVKIVNGRVDRHRRLA